MNRALPETQKRLGLRVKHSNLCFSGKERLLTADGYKTIEEAWAEAGSAHISDGNFKTIRIVNSKGVVEATQVYQTNEAAAVYDVTLHSGRIVRVTAEHKWILQDGSRVQTSELESGDVVNLLRNADLLGFGKGHAPEYAELAGAFIGDGSFTRAQVGDDNTAQLRLWNGEIDEVGPTWLKLVERFHAEEGYDGGPSRSDHFNRRHIEAFGYDLGTKSSKALYRRLVADGVLPTRKHVVPASVWKSDAETVAAFLRGLFTTDGHFQWDGTNGAAVVLSQSSKSLMQDVQLLLQQLGVDSRILPEMVRGPREMGNGSGGSSAYQSRPLHRLFITRRDNIARFASVVGFSQSGKKDRVAAYLAGTTGGKAYSRAKFTDTVVSIQQAGVEPTFCLTEHASHELTVNGVLIGNCTEITLATSRDRTAVCCLSSANALTFDEWKDNPLFIPDLVRFLDNVLEYFIQHGASLVREEDLERTCKILRQELSVDIFTDDMVRMVAKAVEEKVTNGIRKAVYSASQERSIGIGLLGFHSYLQKNNLPFESAMATVHNRRMFSHLKKNALAASMVLADERGECPDALGTGVRNMHLLAVAPNASSSIYIPGRPTSPSIEPYAANAFTHKTQSGSWLVKNPFLEDVLAQYGRNDEETWRSIILNKGSCQHLDFLTDDQKDVFKTFKEIDQRWIIEHAAHRQESICQSQSVNLAFPAGTDITYLHAVHFMAWKRGLKTLYYVRSEEARQADKVSVKISREQMVQEHTCLSCEG